MIAKATSAAIMMPCVIQYVRFAKPKAIHVCSVNFITAKENSQMGGPIRIHVLSGSRKTAAGKSQNKKSTPT